MAGIYNGPIVDPHIHLFNLDTLQYHWLSGPNQISAHPFIHEKINNIRHSWTIDDLLEVSKAHNVVKFVHVQAECADEMAEAQHAEAVAISRSELAGIVTHADLKSSNVEATLKAYSQMPHVKGIRQLLNFHHERTDLRDTPTNYVLEEDWIKGYSLLEKYGLHYEFHGFSTQLVDAYKLASRFPNTPLIINHSGLIIDFSTESINKWKEATRDLASLPNVYVKLSGLAMISHDYTAESIKPFVTHLIEVFGVNRCIFASNYPVEKAVTTYDALYTAFKETVAHLSVEDQRKVFYENAIKFYRIQ